MMATLSHFAARRLSAWREQLLGEAEHLDARPQVTDVFSTNSRGGAPQALQANTHRLDSLQNVWQVLQTTMGQLQDNYGTTMGQLWDNTVFTTVSVFW